MCVLCVSALYIMSHIAFGVCSGLCVLCVSALYIMSHIAFGVCSGLCVLCVSALYIMSHIAFGVCSGLCVLCVSALYIMSHIAFGVCSGLCVCVVCECTLHYVSVVQRTICKLLRERTKEIIQSLITMRRNTTNVMEVYNMCLLQNKSHRSWGSPRAQRCRRSDNVTHNSCQWSSDLSHFQFWHLQKMSCASTVWSTSLLNSDEHGLTHIIT